MILLYGTLLWTIYVSFTDWATVASLGPFIARDMETLRAYILRQLKDVKDSSLVRSRAGIWAKTFGRPK